MYTIVLITLLSCGSLGRPTTMEPLNWSAQVNDIQIFGNPAPYGEKDLIFALLGNFKVVQTLPK